MKCVGSKTGDFSTLDLGLRKPLLQEYVFAKSLDSLKNGWASHNAISELGVIGGRLCAALLFKLYPKGLLLVKQTHTLHTYHPGWLWRNLASQTLPRWQNITTPRTQVHPAARVATSSAPSLSMQHDEGSLHKAHKAQPQARLVARSRGPAGALGLMASWIFRTIALGTRASGHLAVNIFFGG